MMDIAKASRKIKSSATAAGKVVLIYAVFAALWIFGSDTALEALVRNPAEWARVGMFKGLLFVAATALLLYILLIRLLKTTGEARQALAAHYATLIEQARDIVLLIDPAGRIVEANRAAEAAYGYRHAELLGMSVDDLRAPQSLADVKRQWAAAASTEGVLFETRHHHRDGRVFPVEVSSRAIEIEGKLYRQSFIRDITERKQVAAAFKENERLLLESQRIAHIGGWSWAFTGPIQWTDETYRLYGVSPETFKPTLEALVNLVHPEDRPAMQEWVRACSAGGKPAELEFRCVWPDGTVRFLCGRGERINDAENRPTHIFGTVQDITERRQAEAGVIESNNRLTAVMDNLTEGIITADQHGLIYYWNPMALAIYGFASMDECQRPLAEFAEVVELRPLNEDRVLSVEEWPMSRVMRGETLHNWECRLRRLDQGWEKIFAYSGWLIHSANGETFAFLSTNDITERKKTESLLYEQLDELRRWQQTMIGRESRIISMKHEVNELLAQSGQPPRYAEQLPAEPGGGDA